MTTSPKSSQALRSKTELQPPNPARSRHDPKHSNTRFDNNSLCRGRGSNGPDEDFLAGAPSILVLGDNSFFGHGLPEILKSADEQEQGSTVFAYRVSDPKRYGVVAFGNDNQVTEIVEKPVSPTSNYAITGLYFVDGTAPDRARNIKPSVRGEVEIVDLLQSYLNDGALKVRQMGRGYAWLDTGTHGSLLDAGNFARTLQARQGLQVGCQEEIAYRSNWISREQLEQSAKVVSKSTYGKHLLDLLTDDKHLEIQCRQKRS
ncbi:hypothetical protein EGN72_01255 [Pseudorhodobacter sp. E13]|nr:hypothetical protein EGN72_01255 [Pseudorhodobacter sp. E13]